MTVDRRTALTLGLGGLLAGRAAFTAANETNTMRQYVLKPAGNAFALHQETVAAPTAGPGQVLVRIRAASLNRRDVMIRQAMYRVSKPDGLVPLSDGAGEVLAIGDGVTRFKVGDRVMPIFFQQWLSGRPGATITGSALGGELPGVLREQAVFAESGLVAIPSHLPYEAAATLPCAAVTAWHGLQAAGSLGAGDTVLVQGTGGVSIFGLQFAVASGARAVVTSSSDAKLARAKALGATTGINYRTTPDWAAELMKVHPDGATHILEVGGKGTLEQSLKAVARGGHIALIGGLDGYGGEVPTLTLFSRNAGVRGIFVGSRAHFESMNAFITQHRLEPVVDRTFEFDQAADAFAYMDSGSHFGKVVIRV